jgi:hypothetical protein
MGGEQEKKAATVDLLGDFDKAADGMNKLFTNTRVFLLNFICFVYF